VVCAFFFARGPLGAGSTSQGNFFISNFQ